MSSNSIFLPTPLAAGSGCQAYAGAEVTISATGPGFVVVYATVTIAIDHTAGNFDEVDLFVRDTPALCGADGFTTVAFADASQPTGFYAMSVPAMGVFAVGAAGSFTYYLNGENFGVGDALWINAALVAVFYPS